VQVVTDAFVVQPALVEVTSKVSVSTVELPLLTISDTDCVVDAT